MHNIVNSSIVDIVMSPTVPTVQDLAHATDWYIHDGIRAFIPKIPPIELIIATKLRPVDAGLPALPTVLALPIFPPTLTVIIPLLPRRSIIADDLALRIHYRNIRRLVHQTLHTIQRERQIPLSLIHI